MAGVDNTLPPFRGADPKPEPRVKSPEALREAREAFRGHPCVACGDGRVGVSLHHVVPRSQGGDDVVENLVPLCGDGTRGCHGLLETHGPGWERVAARVRAFVLGRASRTGYVVGKIGRERFDRRYPPLPQLAVGDLDRARTPDPTLREGYQT